MGRAAICIYRYAKGDPAGNFDFGTDREFEARKPVLGEDLERRHALMMSAEMPDNVLVVDTFNQ